MNQKSESLSAILRPKDAAVYCAMSVSSLWRQEQRDPRFPAKIRFSARCVGYRRADLDEWLEAKAKRAGGVA